MRKLPVVLGALVVVALAAWPAEGGLPGPFAGVLRQGEVAVWAYDNNPLGAACPPVQVAHRVDLHYQPASDTLTLVVGDRRVDGEAGRASLDVVRPACTSFEVAVEASQVALAAAYALRVSQGQP